MHWSWHFPSGVLWIFCGTHPNQTYILYYPTGLCNVVARFLVVCSDLFASSDWFSCYKISFKFFIKAFFCLLLTCGYLIYWIRVHLSWNLSLGVLESCQWDVSKPGIWIFFPCRFVEGRGEGAIFCGFTSCHQYIDWLQVNHRKFSNFSVL